jgi:hypothetical protein
VFQTLAVQDRAALTGATYCLASVACNLSLKFLKLHLPTQVHRPAPLHAPNLPCARRDPPVPCRRRRSRVDAIPQVLLIINLMLCGPRGSGVDDPEGRRGEPAAPCHATIGLPQADIVPLRAQVRQGETGPGNHRIGDQHIRLLKRTGGDTSLVVAEPAWGRRRLHEHGDDAVDSRTIRQSRDDEGGSDNSPPARPP